MLFDAKSVTSSNIGDLVLWALAPTAAAVALFAWSRRQENRLHDMRGEQSSVLEVIQHALEYLKERQRKIFSWVVIALPCLALAGAVALIVWRTYFERFLGADVFKLTYEFLLIGVVGGAITAIYKEIQRSRDERAAERTLQRQFLDDCVNAYNAAKKARRLLRAKAIKLEPTPHVDREPYDEQMQDLMDVQLDFELFVSRASPTLFPGLETDLGKIRDYLHDILDEYSTCLPEFSGSPPTLPFKSDSRLAEFTDKYKKGSAFDKEFKRPFDRITEIFQSLVRK